MPRVKTTARIVPANTSAQAVDQQVDVSMASQDAAVATVRLYEITLFVFQCVA